MSRPAPMMPPPPLNLLRLPREFLEVFRYGRKALDLVWRRAAVFPIWLAVLTVLAGALPALVAWLGARIVDAVVAASSGGGDIVAGAGAGGARGR